MWIIIGGQIIYDNPTLKKLFKIKKIKFSYNINLLIILDE
jgi:hypothetical protein